MTIELTALQQQRRDTAANWTSANPTLLTGEIGYETDTGKFKIGDGSTVWTGLGYLPIPDSSGLIPISQLLLPLGSASAPSLAFTGDANTGIYSPGADSLAITTAGTQRVTVDSSGKVGIGTTAPQRNFHIHEPASSTTVGMMLTNGGTGASNDSQGFQLKVGGDTHAEIAQMENSNLRFLTNATERMRIDSDGRLLLGLSSTIGSNALLQVQGSGNRKVQFHQPDTGSCFAQFTNTTTGSGVGDGVLIGLDGDESLLIAQKENNDIQIHTNNTERMRIDSAGAVTVKRASTYTTGLQHGLAIQQASATNGNRAGLVFKSLDGFSIAGINGVISTHSGTQANNVGYLEFYTKASGTSSAEERMRIDSNGKLVVGATSFLSGANSFSQAMISGSVGGLIINSTDTSASSYCRLMFTPNGHITGNEGLIRYNTSDYHMSFWTQGNERMRITSAGEICMGPGNNGISSSYAQSIKITPNSGGTIYVNHNTGTHYALAFVNTSINVIGSITTSNIATAFNTSSDYRLKENVVNIADGIARVKQLAPKRFNFIVDTDTTVDGFLAHEAQTVVPEAVTGTKDEVDADGNAVIQGIDQSKLVPLLTAALQEAIAKIETLEAKVAALEAG